MMLASGATRTRRAFLAQVSVAVAALGVLLLGWAADSTAAPHPAAASTKGTEIHGYVIGADGKPVDQAVVLVLPLAPDAPPGAAPRPTTVTIPARAETRADGSFSVHGLSGPVFAVRVEARGYAPFTQLDAKTGSTVSVSLRRGFALSGVVRDRSTRKPIAGVAVLVRDPDAELFGEAGCSTAVSGIDGRFELPGVPQGTVTVEARAAGRPPGKLENVSVPQRRSVATGEVMGLEFFLEAIGRLAGRVVGPDRKPIAGVSLEVSPVDPALAELLPGRGLRTVATDPSGAFAFEAVPRGRYRLIARMKGFAPFERAPIDVPGAGDSGKLEIRLDVGAALTVRLLDPARRPVHDLAVEIFDESRVIGRRKGPSPGLPVSRDEIVEGEGGLHTVRHLAPGTFTVRLLPGEGGDVEKQGVKLENGITTDLGTVVVAEGRDLAGRVTDSGNAPVEGAEVTAAWHDGDRLKTRQARTKADGRYRIPGLVEPRVDLVTVRAKGFAPAERDGARAGDLTVDFVLVRGGSIVGRVVASSGAVPAAFRVKIRADGGGAADSALPAGQAGEQASTDPAGGFRVVDLAPGTYILDVTAQHGSSVEKSGISVAAEQVTDVGTVTLEAGVTLRGRVVAARDGSPVSGAAVRVDLPQTSALRVDAMAPALGRAVSAGDGSFVIGGLEAGALQVVVEHPSFSPSRTRVELSEGGETPDLVVQMYRGGTLTGTVFGAQQQPVPDAGIVVYTGVGDDVRNAVTDAEGRYLFPYLTPGTYEVMREPVGGFRGVGPGAKTAVIVEGETTTLDFDTTPKIVLAGRVLRGDTLLPNTAIVLSPTDATAPPGVKSARSDAEGGYRIGLDFGGAYQASVQTGAPGGLSSVRLVIPDQPEVQQDIVLPMNSISGRITGPDGIAIEGATITTVRDATSGGDPARPFSAKSGPDGAYRVEGVDQGTYRVTARAQGYQAAELYPLAVSDETPTPTADLSLEPGWPLRGRLVDPKGLGIRDAMVVVAPPGLAESGSLPTRTDANGSFRITAPTDGPVNITAIPVAWAPALLTDVLPPSEDNGPEILMQASLGGTLRVRVVRSSGGSVAGVQVVLRPDPLFPGWDYVADRNPPRPTDADGSTLVPLLSPGNYVITVPGHPGVGPVPVAVAEGGEASALVSLP
ncbi:MAG: carboxypeptidase-like regulatory domain-containing protein [Acidobacteriia bacterium]|nr:carboxypeptidase-like regulatory domain-containing protein [Terriglobia bacterium]